MQITRLRLSGFKSFVEPTELHINPGLTGVVGPNGCGKSNLLEAIRWVMGESSPKSLRGGGMDDVIFAGTATRPSRDFAEVTLVYESQGATLPGFIDAKDGDVIEVVRRIERGAGSAYRANGNDVRAKDVALIFADAATGAHSPALVSQGKVAAIISAKPQERRQLLEEAAGISGLHVRRKDAEQKLRATESNLSRIADILADMDNRTAALRRQARAAERYSRLSSQILTAEARMIFVRWRDAALAADAARAEAAAADIAVDAATGDQHGAAQAQAQGIATMATSRAAASAEREADHALAAQLAGQRSEQQALARRLAELEQEAERIAHDRDAEDSLAREGAAAIERLEDAARQAARQMTARDKDRPAIETQMTSATDSLRDAEVSLAQARADAATEAAERRIAEAVASEAQRRFDRIDADLSRLAHDAKAAGDGPALTALADRLRIEAGDAQQAINDREGGVAAAGLARSDAFKARDVGNAALAEAGAALAALESEAAALERSLSASASDDGQMLDHLRAAPSYEAALAAALADDLTAPLMRGDTGGQRGWRGAQALPGDPSLADGLEPLSAHVDAPPELARRLAQIGVADRDDGQALAVGQRLVTRDGAMRRWDGFVSNGDGAATAERLARRNRIETIARQLPDVRAGLAQIERAAALAQEDATSAEACLVEARGLLSQAEDADRLARRAADQADAALERQRATSAYVAERQTSAAAEQAEAAIAQQETAALLSAQPDGAASAVMLEQSDLGAACARTTLNSLRDSLGEIDRDCARLRETQIEAQAEARGWLARAGEAARRITSMTLRFAAIDTEQQQLAGQPAGLGAAILASESQAEAQRLKVEAAILAERAAAEAMAALEARLDTAREALASAREARAGAAARADNSEARRIEMGRVSGERFACPPPLLPEKLGFDADTVASPQHESALHERLHQDRERIGPVNLVAAQELIELEAEHAGTAAEADELHQAVNRLRGSIGHLNREGRQRLLEAFERVDHHFQRLFATLFDGGQAHLAMVDADDPLEAGLEIMAQPPGKKLASLTLLSGGEQALTAIALIFALFLTNPAPICVLDEVDAPLDDANIERFCDLLDHMVADTSTRYLIVTHNAVTMARMHRLFGVTMVEQGVSRLVSVDLGGAEQLMAAE